MDPLAMSIDQIFNMEDDVQVMVEEDERVPCLSTDDAYENPEFV